MDIRKRLAPAVFALSLPILCAALSGGNPTENQPPVASKGLAAPLPTVAIPAAVLSQLPKAERVVAVIDGPATADLGDLIILDGSESLGVDASRWLLASQPPGVDKSRSLLAVDGGQRAVFASGTAGEYRFLLSVAGVVDSKAQLSIATHTVKVGKVPPGPGPQPPGPDPPPGPILTGWAKFAYDTAFSIAVPHRAKASEIAANMEAVGSRLAAGGYGTGAETDQIAAALAELTSKNRETLPVGPVRDAWLPWLSAWAQRAGTDLKGKSKADHVTAFQETAKGLKEIK